MRYDFNKIIKTLIKKNYTVFYGSSSDSYDLNLVGIRSTNARVDYFDDILAVFFYNNYYWDYREYNVTTLPGLPYLQSPMSANGCAIIKDGQYKGLWQLGMHFSQFALVQKNPITVIRDNDKDGHFDFDGPTETGMFGINCHRKEITGISERVSIASAGCVVHADHERFDNEFMPLCKTAAGIWGNSFTFTLLNEVDVLSAI